MKDLHAVLGPDFTRLFAGIQTPEAPIPYFTAPDLGCPDQGYGDEPKPFAAPKFTPQERDTIALMTIELDDKRREANKRDADRDIARLGVVFTDDDPEAA